MSNAAITDTAITTGDVPDAFSAVAETVDVADSEGFAGCEEAVVVATVAETVDVAELTTVSAVVSRGAIESVTGAGT